ncbi:MAG TPA: hypothetical protein VFM18_18595 [Methanosarcina sp.]|nr:hypothetical protein [Methanosarcina sp.]
MFINDMFKSKGNKKTVKEDSWHAGDEGLWGTRGQWSEDTEYSEIKDQFNEYLTAASIPNDSESAIPGSPELDEMANTAYHRVGVTVLDPNGPVSQRKEPKQRTVRVKGSEQDAIEKAKNHFRKKGYKVIDAWYIEGYDIGHTEPELSEGITQQDLADVLFTRLEHRFPDVVSRYGHEIVGDAVNDVASFHAGAEEMGTSDIGAMLRQIMQQLEDRAELDEDDDYKPVGRIKLQNPAPYKPETGLLPKGTPVLVDLSNGEGKLQHGVYIRKGRVGHQILVNGELHSVQPEDIANVSGKEIGKWGKKATAKESQLDEFGGGGYPKTQNYQVGDRVYVKNYQGVGKIKFIKHRNEVGVLINEPSMQRIVTTIDDLRPAPANEGIGDTAKEIAGRIAKTFTNPTGAAAAEYKKPFWTKKIGKQDRNKPLSNIRNEEINLDEAAAAVQNGDIVEFRKGPYYHPGYFRVDTEEAVGANQNRPWVGGIESGNGWYVDSSYLEVVIPASEFNTEMIRTADDVENALGDLVDSDMEYDHELDEDLNLSPRMASKYYQVVAHYSDGNWQSLLHSTDEHEMRKEAIEAAEAPHSQLYGVSYAVTNPRKQTIARYMVKKSLLTKKPFVVDLVSRKKIKPAATLHEGKDPHGIIAQKLKDVESSKKLDPISDEAYAAHKAKMEKQRAEYVKNNPNTIYKEGAVKDLPKAMYNGAYAAYNKDENLKNPFPKGTKNHALWNAGYKGVRYFSGSQIDNGWHTNEPIHPKLTGAAQKIKTIAEARRSDDDTWPEGHPRSRFNADGTRKENFGQFNKQAPKKEEPKREPKEIDEDVIGKGKWYVTLRNGKVISGPYASAQEADKHCVSRKQQVDHGIDVDGYIQKAVNEYLTPVRYSVYLVAKTGKLQKPTSFDSRRDAIKYALDMPSIGSIVIGHNRESGAVKIVRADFDVNVSPEQQKQLKMQALEHCKKGISEHIVKHGSGYRLLSHKGKNLGDFPSKAAAKKHEGEVNYFKHATEGALSKRDLKDIEAIKSAVEKLEQQKTQPNADISSINKKIEHEKKRLELYTESKEERDARRLEAYYLEEMRKAGYFD